MTRAALTVALLLLLLLAPAAHAEPTFPGQHPATSPALTKAVDIGEAYWQARGVMPCAHPMVYTADTLADVDVPIGYAAQERAQGCSIWLARLFVPIIDLNAYGRLRLCAVIAHALGHTAGLGHTLSGVMAPVEPDTPRQLRRAAPRECRAWARRTTAARSGLPTGR